MTLTEALIHAQMAGKRIESYNPTDGDDLTDDFANDEMAELLADEEEFDWRGEGD